MKAREIAQVTDSIPGEIFRTHATDCLVTRFNNVAKIAEPDAQIKELEKIRDESYKLAHDVWDFNPFYNHSKNFQSAYALFHAAKTMVDASLTDSADVRQSLRISLFRHWKCYVEASVDNVRQKGGVIAPVQTANGIFKSSFTITGGRKSLEALRDELPVLRMGQLTP